MSAQPAFQDFQREFGRYLRDPRGAARPAGVPARRAGVYRELLFNNVRGVVEACFPISRELLGERRWGRLMRAFFVQWRSQTPLFCELPREFLRWINAALAEERLPVAMPAWLPELMHYEWAELAIDIMPVDAPAAWQAGGDLMAGRPLVAPAHMLMSYEWPVHRIGSEFRPRKPEATHLVVFRDSDDDVQFAVINPVTARLIALLHGNRMSGAEACLQVAHELRHPDPQVVLAGGAAMLNELRNWGVVYGTVA